MNFLRLKDYCDWFKNNIRELFLAVCAAECQAGLSVEIRSSGLMLLMCCVYFLKKFPPCLSGGSHESKITDDLAASGQTAEFSGWLRQHLSKQWPPTNAATSPSQLRSLWPHPSLRLELTEKSVDGIPPSCSGPVFVAACGTYHCRTHDSLSGICSHIVPIVVVVKLSDRWIRSFDSDLHRTGHWTRVTKESIVKFAEWSVLRRCHHCFLTCSLSAPLSD